MQHIQLYAEFFHKGAYIGQLHDDPYAAGKRAGIGDNLPRSDRGIISARCGHCTKRGHHRLFLVTPPDLLEYLLRGAHSPARAVYPHYDRLDVRVLAELPEGLERGLGLGDDAFDIHHPYFVARTDDRPHDIWPHHPKYQQKKGCRRKDRKPSYGGQDYEQGAAGPAPCAWLGVIHKELLPAPLCFRAGDALLNKLFLEETAKGGGPPLAAAR